MYKILTWKCSSKIIKQQQQTHTQHKQQQQKVVQAKLW